MSPAIEVEGLRKVYRRPRRGPLVALDGLDLSVPEGCVFGFLGPNGSGKTTTIRCLLGLVRPSAGTARLLGVAVPGALPAVAGRVGSIVETPHHLPNLSGRRNLALLGRLHGAGPRAVDDALARAGLAERADDLVRSYSLGMRQRLGLAAALLKDPEVVILDEPANGLDPAGMRDIRHLLRSLAAEGRTVFVSSHLLAEVGQACDHVAVLRRGRCVAAGPVGEVLTGRRDPAVLIRIDDLAGGAAALEAAGVASAVLDGALRIDAPPAAAAISQILGEAGHWVSELRPIETSLEDAFLELTADDVRPEEVPA